MHFCPEQHQHHKVTGERKIINIVSIVIKQLTYDIPEQAGADDAEDNGIEYAIGPMNGDTWHSYRLVSGTDNSPAYFMEPQNPAFYPEIFQQSGFDVIGAYSSGRVDLTTTHSDYADIEGINICPFSTQSANSELEKIYQLSLKAFAGNFLYTPIGRDN